MVMAGVFSDAWLMMVVVARGILGAIVIGASWVRRLAGGGGAANLM
jgi:hypothetical protein